MPMKEVMPASGSTSSIRNSESPGVQASMVSITPVYPVCTNWLTAVPPKGFIHSAHTTVAMISTQITNSRTLRPRESRAMKMPAKGDQEIHQAQ